MNNKYIAILMIIGLLTVGLSSVSADNITSDTIQDVDTQETTDTQENDMTTDDTSADDVVLTSSNEDDENISDNITTQPTQITQSDLSEEAQLLYDADDENIALLIEALDEYEGDFDELVSLLKNRDNCSVDDITQALYDLDDDLLDEYDKVSTAVSILSLPEEDYNNFLTNLKASGNSAYDNLINILNSSDDIYVADVVDELFNLSSEDYDYLPSYLGIESDEETNLPISNPFDNNKKVQPRSKVTTNNNNNFVSDVINQIVAPFTKNTKQAKTIYKQDSNLDAALQELFEKFFLGQITFDQLKESLEELGVDTSTLILNEDGSISFNGETFSLSDLEDNATDDTTNSTIDEANTADDDLSANDTTDNINDTSDATADDTNQTV